MGKSSVGHQIPTPSAAGGSSSSSRKGSDNNSHGTSSPASSVASAVAAAALSSASRDVFQGLFLDLGKQAMAMEAVLRLICGKVDSMEAWMTEVAFGMTELDLKLRNIAHNIEGTAANVDDEAANVHRWAAPPQPQDDRAHVAATVKKKLGPNKKSIKVSGMVAAIIDTLSVPADERDNAVFSMSSSGSNDLAAATERPTSATSGTHKKKHHKKKTHDKPQSKEAGSSAAENGNEGRITGVDGDAEAGNIVTDGQAMKADEEAELNEGEPPEPLMEVKTPVPTLAEQVQQEEDHGNNHTSHGVTRSLDSERSQSEATRGGAMDRSIDLEGKSEPEHGNEENSDSTAVGDEQAHGTSTEKELKKDVQEELVHEASSSETEQQPFMDAQEHQVARTESASSTRSKQPTSVEISPSVPQNHAAAVSESVGQPVQTEAQDNAQMQAPSPGSEVPPDTAKNTVQKPKSQSPPQKETVSGGCLPLPPQEDANPDTTFELSTPTLSVSTTTIDSPAGHPSSPSASSPGKLAKRSSSTKQMANADVNTSSKPALVKKKSSRKAMEAAMRRASSGQKVQLTSRKSKSAVDPAAADESEHEQAAPTPIRDGTDASDRNAVVKSQVVTQTSPKTEAQPDNGEEDVQEGSEADDVVNSDGSNDDESNSDEDSRSSSSPSDSDNQDGGEVQADGTGAGIVNAAVKSAARRLSKMPGPTSKMTRTITALKKLKEANMLTPEEEEELKQRAQEKWFKLKGHVKEKKKKDVANILLKRKKNVFTVSARIELLEEKSKEVFASIKQLANDLKTKMDLSASDILRRQVFDINLSLQALDHKITHGATPAMEKVLQLSKEVELVRSSFSQQLVFVNEDIAATKLRLATSRDEHRDQLEFLSQSFQQQVANLVEEHDAKLKSLPDHSAAIEGVKRMLRRKADLKLLKECVV